MIAKIVTNTAAINTAEPIRSSPIKPGDFGNCQLP